MHQVKPAGAELEIERLEVDDDLVALAAASDQPDFGLGRALFAVDLDLEVLEGALVRLDRDHDAAPQLQHRAQASRRAKVTSSIPSRASTLTRSVGSWLRSVPLARFTQRKPAASSALASLAPPVTMWRGS